MISAALFSQFYPVHIQKDSIVFSVFFTPNAPLFSSVSHLSSIRYKHRTAPENISFFTCISLTINKIHSIISSPHFFESISFFLRISLSINKIQSPINSLKIKKIHHFSSYISLIINKIQSLIDPLKIREIPRFSTVSHLLSTR